MIVFLAPVLLSMPLLSAMTEDEPRQIPTPPFSYQFTGHVTSSTLPEISPGMLFTGILSYRRLVPSTEGLPYVLTVTIDDRTFCSTYDQMEKRLQVDTLDLLALKHQIIPPLPGYEGQQFGLRFLASGARWIMIAHGVLRSPGQHAEDMMISGKIDQFTEIDEAATCHQ